MARAGMLRVIAVLAGLSLLLLAATNHDVREFFLLKGNLLSAIIFSLFFLALLPSRLFLLAPVLGALLLYAARKASKLKIGAVGLPITYMDISTTLHDPITLFRALGYHGSLLVPAVAICTGLAGLVILLVKFLGFPTGKQLVARIAEFALILALAGSSLQAAGLDIRNRLATLYPENVLDLWEAQGQVALAYRVGPLEYLAFTRAAGDADSGFAQTGDPVPLPTEEIKQAVDKRVDWKSGVSGKLPNIVLFHAESSFDPNGIFRLEKPAILPLWSRGPDTHALGPLRVNVVGGGSWVTEFEVLTGADSRGFGYDGFYAHQTIAPRVRMALPRFLADLGYLTSAYYTADGNFFGVAQAFRHYGFRNFFEAKTLGLPDDWSESDRTIMRSVIDHGAFHPNSRPMFLFLSTVENHGPHPCVHFKRDGEFANRFQGMASFAENCALNEYLLRARSTSASLEMILNQLKAVERTTGRPYILLAYGDHQPWSFTDGLYSIAGGLADDTEMKSFSRFRRGRNNNITFFHLFGSGTTRLAGPFNAPIPTTLIPTLISAYTAHDAAGLYMPSNYLAYQDCGSDYRARSCRLTHDIDDWQRQTLLGRQTLLHR